MNKLKYALIATLACGLGFTACEEDELCPGHPQMNIQGDLGTACFGDSLKFTIHAHDNEVPLSTLRSKLYFGDELVSEDVVRTKVSGRDYDCKVFIPYFANIPDGKAVLQVTLQNINFTTVEQYYEVAITHPDYEYLTFVSTDPEAPGEWRMNRKSQYNYEFSDKLPQKINGYIVAPAFGENGNELRFGYENNRITIGAETAIPFANTGAGKYTIAFNTFTFKGSPFIVHSLNGVEFTGIDATKSYADLTLSKGQTISQDGFPDINEWWIDRDFITLNNDNSFKFQAESGRYRFIADEAKKYFRIQVLNGSEPAKTQADGSGALWVIGENIGKPSVATNAVGWTTENALCMAPVANKVYEMTLVGGKTVALDKINFKFFGEMGWGGELKFANFAEITSTLVGVGDGTTHDNGNLYLLDGVQLKANTIYKMRVDLTGGQTSARFTFYEDGEEAFEEKRVLMGDLKMNTMDNAVYTIDTQMTQGQNITFNGFNALADMYIDPDFFEYDAENEKLTFLPVDGNYRVTLNTASMVLGAQRLNSDGSLGTFTGDAHAIYVLGYGVGSPSLDNQFGWEEAKAYNLAEIERGIYRFSGYAGPENNSEIGQRIRYDYVDFKFFHQQGWGGEFNPSQGSGIMPTSEASELLQVTGSGNFNLAAGVQLEKGAYYVITVNTNNRTIDIVKK